MGRERRLHTFDVLRIAAAVLVVFDHSWYAQRGRELVPLTWHDYRWTWGRLAVAIFFAISGFLVTRSWLSDPDAARFALKRIARLWPALTVAILAATFVIGPFATNLHDEQYLASPGTWGYLIRGLLVVPVGQALPGVFTAHPVAQVNGPLWTLGVELCAYALLAAIGATQLRKGRNWVVPLAAVGFGLLGWHELDNLILARSVPAGIVSRSQLIAVFLASSAIALYHDRVPLTSAWQET